MQSSQSLVERVVCVCVEVETPSFLPFKSRIFFSPQSLMRKCRIRCSAAAWLAQFSRGAWKRPWLDLARFLFFFSFLFRLPNLGAVESKLVNCARHLIFDFPRYKKKNSRLRALKEFPLPLGRGSSPFFVCVCHMAAFVFCFTYFLMKSTFFCDISPSPVLCDKLDEWKSDEQNAIFFHFHCYIYISQQFSDILCICGRSLLIRIVREKPCIGTYVRTLQSYSSTTVVHYGTHTHTHWFSRLSLLQTNLGCIRPSLCLSFLHCTGMSFFFLSNGSSSKGRKETSLKSRRRTRRGTASFCSLTRAARRRV